MNDIDWASLIEAVLKSTPFMALATRGPEGIWSNPVHFAYDSDLNLYFISQPGSRHMRNIKGDSDVAVSVYTTNQPALGHVVGLQLQGMATIASDDEVEEIHQTYYGRPEFNTVSVPASNYQGANAPWRFVRIVPNEIGYFDSGRFSNERQVVPEGTKL